MSNISQEDIYISNLKDFYKNKGINVIVKNKFLKTSNHAFYSHIMDNEIYIPLANVQNKDFIEHFSWLIRCNMMLNDINNYHNILKLFKIKKVDEKLYLILKLNNRYSIFYNNKLLSKMPNNGYIKIHFLPIFIMNEDYSAKHIIIRICSLLLTDSREFIKNPEKDIFGDMDEPTSSDRQEYNYEDKKINNHKVDRNFKYSTELQNTNIFIKIIIEEIINTDFKNFELEFVNIIEKYIPIDCTDIFSDNFIKIILASLEFYVGNNNINLINLDLIEEIIKNIYNVQLYLNPVNYINNKLSFLINNIDFDINYNTEYLKQLFDIFIEQNIKCDDILIDLSKIFKIKIEYIIGAVWLEFLGQLKPKFDPNIFKTLLNRTFNSNHLH